MNLRLILAGLVLVLGGCVTPPPAGPEESPPAAKPQEAPAPGETQEREARPEPEVAPPRVEIPARPDPEDLERLLSYFEHIRKLPAVDFVRESESARAAFTRTRSDFDRVRLALLLSIPNTALSDDQRAADLLDPLVKNQNSSLRGFALLMSAHLQERRRLESGMQSLLNNVQGLQQKLDALMSLERSLIDREQSGPARKR
jgi:hypothetical protein